MSGPTVVLPDSPISEWTAIRTNSATGLFAFRQMQAIDLLEFPDYGGGDMTAEQRREALCNAVSFQKPLAALALFLGVVALEDFVRDFGARMADDITISCLFPALTQLRSKPIPRRPDQAFKRLDTDPTGVVDPEQVNKLFLNSLGVEPIPSSEYPRLRDLALIRHTVAHHAAVIRPVDVPRFQYYIVRPEQQINPPVAFVRETLMYLYQTGRVIEDAVRHMVFSSILPKLPNGWWTLQPDELTNLIEFFDYFGFIETTNLPVGYVAPGTPEYEERKEESDRIRAKLLARCIQELRERYTP
jgi:hypothetical protein